MFYYYKKDSNTEYSNNFYKYLKILRMDLTEKELFDFRFLHDEPKNINKLLTHNYRCNKNKTLKNIAFISNDFSLNRPTGILCQNFFEYLILQNHVNIFLISKYNIYFPFDKCKNTFVYKNSNQLNLYIKKNNIDILIDMQGHMIDNYMPLLSKRFAPIQIHFLGYPGTLGSSSIDYLIADKVIVPETSRDFYREKIAYMPNCYQVNSESIVINKFENKNTEKGKNYFKFCCFNEHYKLDKKCIYIFIEILKKVPNSILYLITGIYDNDIKNICKNMNVSNRVVIYKKTSHKFHIERISHMDLVLDNYRLNGHTTSSDAIAAGVPIITYTGHTYHNRVTKSILKSIDLEELVCNSFNKYVKLAVKIASDSNYHKSLIDKVQMNRRKTLFNSKLYADNFIKLLKNIWSHHYSNNYIENEFMITNFGNNTINKNYKWKFISNTKINKKSMVDKDVLIMKCECRGQILRDIADYSNDCVLFTTCGMLFNNISVLQTNFIKSDNYHDGIWVKMRYNISNENISASKRINNDYNLPLVRIYYKINNKTTLKEIELTISYHLFQHYLNTKLIICNNDDNYSNISKEKEMSEIKYNMQYVSKSKIKSLVKDKNIYHLFLNKNNINIILNDYNYIQKTITNNPNNFIIY